MILIYGLVFVLLVLAGGLAEAAISNGLTWEEPEVMLAFLAFEGLILFACYKVIKNNWEDAKKTKLKDEAKEMAKDVLVADFSGVEDSNDNMRLVTKFRKSLAEFFNQRIMLENAAIQDDATQMYWNIAQFRKKRLERLNVKMDFKSERKNYGDAFDSFREVETFDGRYMLTRIKEHIAACATYVREGKQLFKRTYTQAAYYTVLSAKTQGKGTVICPNCGAESTRENLIDGCDFCGTKFTIEDLGKRVGDFALRSDYEIQLAKFDKASRAVINSFLFALDCITFICVAPYMFLGILDEMGGIMYPLFAAVFGGGMAVGFVHFVFSKLIAFMVLNVTVVHNIVNHFVNIPVMFYKQAEAADAKEEKAIRKYDPEFSIGEFYSNVQNKLAAIHYADFSDQINAFTNFDLSDKLAAYKNIMNVDVDSIALKKYDVKDGYQVAKVDVKLTLLMDNPNGKRAFEKGEKLQLTLVKSAVCKSQAVCGPSVMTCKGCGASISLLDGKTCPHCGREIDLAEHDWVISSYKVA